MTTYLLTWNPDFWQWENIENHVEQIKTTGSYIESWSCGVTKKIIHGDRVFLMKLGSKQIKGIVASGWVIKDSHFDKHWDTKLAEVGKETLYVKVDFDTILSPEKPLPQSFLKSAKYNKFNWSPRASGATIPSDIANCLEEDWAEFLSRKRIQHQNIFSEEVENNKVFTEGTLKQILVNQYERDPKAREVCINHYGFICKVCEFDFEKKYGEIGKGFIHVHHLKPLSEIGKEYKLNPITDLLPVCPNCHAMLHKKKPPFSIEELINRMK